MPTPARRSTILRPARSPQGRTHGGQSKLVTQQHCLRTDGCLIAGGQRRRRSDRRTRHLQFGRNLRSIDAGRFSPAGPMTAPRAMHFCGTASKRQGSGRRRRTPRQLRRSCSIPRAARFAPTGSHEHAARDTRGELTAIRRTGAGAGGEIGLSRDQFGRAYTIPPPGTFTADREHGHASDSSRSDVTAGRTRIGDRRRQRSAASVRFRRPRYTLPYPGLGHLANRPDLPRRARKLRLVDANKWPCSAPPRPFHGPSRRTPMKVETG